MAASVPSRPDAVKPGDAGKVLIVVHQAHSTPGRVGLKSTARGHELDIRRPCLGHPLPKNLDEYAGVVVFGGPQSANDCEPYLAEEMNLIECALKEDAPFLGICLGAQMLVRQLGGKVTPHREGRAEIGYYPIKPTRAGEQLMAGWPDHVYQWHREGFDVPTGAEMLARSDGDFEVQAIRAGRSAFGIQFHPEVTRLMIHRWTTKAAQRLELPGAQPREAHIAGRFLYDDAVDKWLEAFLDLWLASDRRAEALAAE